jgi:hypothetical protein
MLVFLFCCLLCFTFISFSFLHVFVSLPIYFISSFSLRSSVTTLLLFLLLPLGV